MFFSQENVTGQVRCPLWGGFVPGSEAAKEESSFSEEKEAKRLLFWRPRQLPGPILKRGGLDLGSSFETKVFCFFSSEKNNLFHFGAVLRLQTPHPNAPHKGEGEVGQSSYFT